MKEFPKAYEPKKVENRIYNLWQKGGFFNPDMLPKTYNLKTKTYCIVIPPPNITGTLHMGHALNALVQDILIRWKRLQGFKTLWLPGTDHAAIATQNVIEKELKKEGKTRLDLGKEEFLKRFWQWVQKYGDIILEQFKKLGCSLDWSRTRFTMDKDYERAVKFAFSHYYKKGLIYQGKKPINWCKRCQTSLSDLELEYQEEKGKLWYIRYPLSKPYTLNAKPYIVVATTRPETMLGDTVVAVNPKDKRYKNLIGKKVIIPLVWREILIITDRLIDPKFGTGAVKITPAHDLIDYEIGLKNNLKIIQVIGENGKITGEVPEAYRGLSILEVREKIINDLKNQGLLEKTEEYSHQIPYCYRCQSKTEVIPSEQWFLKMGDLAKMAIKAVKTGRIKFVPKNFEKIYFDWLTNIKDWCISRQLWIGHKIPLKGVEDVLDTWFSSALWPFATLGWPQKVKSSKLKFKSDLDRFYSTDVLVTARDIINLWVARMIFSGMEFMKEIPFKTVYIHATVLTREGKRMSKSLGTGVDPLNLIETYGADATRFGIAYQIMGGQDIRFTEDNIIMGRKFCNKLWNAAKFVLLQFPNFSPSDQNLAWGQNFQFSKKFQISKLKLTKADKRILKSLNRTIKSVNKYLENFRFGQATHKLYDFFWHDFCDIYIEVAKKQLQTTNYKLPRSKTGSLWGRQTTKILFYVLLNSLILLHPFIPFITEEIYQKLPIKDKKKCLMVEEWPHHII